MSIARRLFALILCALMLVDAEMVVGNFIPRMLRNYIAGRQERDATFFDDGLQKGTMNIRSRTPEHGGRE